VSLGRCCRLCGGRLGGGGGSGSVLSDDGRRRGSGPALLGIRAFFVLAVLSHTSVKMLPPKVGIQAWAGKSIDRMRSEGGDESRECGESDKI